MIKTINRSTLAPSARTLAALRSLAASPSASTTHMFEVAEQQAHLLRDMLPIPADEIPAKLGDLMPGIVVEYIELIPVFGISFWANGRWHIHVRASDSPYYQAFTVAHELKHIIDHPLHQAVDPIDGALWEKLANHFAAQVLVIRAAQFATAGEGGGADE